MQPRRLSWRAAGTEWAEYVTDNNYTPAASQAKRKHGVAHLRRECATVWDLAPIRGVHVELLRGWHRRLISFDVDPAAVERNYRRARAEGRAVFLPLCSTSPTPPPRSVGPAGNGVARAAGPGGRGNGPGPDPPSGLSATTCRWNISRAISRGSRHLIIEFVPKSDSQVKRLLLSGRHLSRLHHGRFEDAFWRHYTSCGAADRRVRALALFHVSPYPPRPHDALPGSVPFLFVVLPILQHSYRVPWSALATSRLLAAVVLVCCAFLYGLVALVLRGRAFRLVPPLVGSLASSVFTVRRAQRLVPGAHLLGRGPVALGILCIAAGATFAAVWWVRGVPGT